MASSEEETKRNDEENGTGRKDFSYFKIKWSNGRKPDPSRSLSSLQSLNDALLNRFLDHFPELRTNFTSKGKDFGREADCEVPSKLNRLPMAPPLFHPLSPGYQNSGLGCKANEKRWVNRCCRTVYFLGSGKCGSTSLALLLKHNMSNIDLFDPTSGFADGGKEPCWALSSGEEEKFYNKFRQCSITCNPSKNKTVVLDGCPRYSKASSARKITCSDPHAKFVMLVRDPLLRSISDHNDYLIRGSGKSAAKHEKDRRTLSLRSLTLSDYHSILRNFLTYVPPQNILIIQSEYFHNQKYVQHIMNEVQSHFEIPKRKIHGVLSNVNSETTQYTLPWKSSLDSSLEKLCPKSINFFKLVGYRFDWILSSNDKRNSKFYYSNI